MLDQRADGNRVVGFGYGTLPGIMITESNLTGVLYARNRMNVRAAANIVSRGVPSRQKRRGQANQEPGRSGAKRGKPAECEFRLRLRQNALAAEAQEKQDHGPETETKVQGKCLGKVCGLASGRGDGHARFYRMYMRVVLS